MLSVFADEHVDPALLAALRVRGCDADGVNQRGLQRLSDAEVLAFALREERLVLTTDTDFLAIAAALQSKQEEFAPIVWWPQAERTIGHLLSRIVPVLFETDYANLCSRVNFV